ncbi:hypothetical protein N7466_011610 [Penicillium verhagenii]|uniref:uncharacterized protein n=1 Tax=Penicillium verhagenii TaxID=1562060 RepID=UPI0025458E37|nr:uncharacterized protein N7466_011610 [Penicillium verhagenii]KAJ5915677.1 hypothetical protein N7466_011610 [Penicillium verhagenii]
MAYRGSWRSRGNMSNRGGPNRFGKQTRSQAPCMHFQRGTCRYGNKCRFSHGQAAESKSSPTEHHPTAHDLHARNQYFDWKRLLRRGIMRTDLSEIGNKELFECWDGALKILEADGKENHQFLAKDLVDDNLHGHDIILATAEEGYLGDLKPIFAYDKPFLEVITHPSLLNCLSVDSFVGTLYASFGGTNGDRAIRYLKSVCQNMMRKGEENNGDSSMVTSLETMKLVLNTLYQLLSRVRRVRFHDDLPALLDLTSELSFRLTEKCLPADLDGLNSRIEVMQSLIASANRNLVPSEVTTKPAQKAESILSSFPMDMQIPGGRHDNDFADISQIQIFPTHGEIVSDNAEYLPSTNFLQPHFIADPLQRYIDSTFRLLRHDIFGSAKDVLRDLMQQDSLSRIQYFSGKDTQAHIYQNAQVRQIFINDKNELEAIVSFSTPPQLRTKTTNEQCRWWQDSSRLEEGSLVCFLVSQGTHRRIIFLEVSVKNAAKDRNQLDVKEWHKSCLVSAKSPPSITVKLAACLENELVFLGQLFSEKVVGVLADFHGLIPATFAPILKNLQRIQAEGDLAFRRWILPGRKNDQNGQIIPPPAYARKPGFIFPLTSIASSGAEDIALDPSSPGNIDILKLQAETGLDPGQCRGLIAALSREYALIQGPPGTGKSYLGVKLVQALLEIKKNADLGPILVICYTNHALDQFLKHLLDVDIQRIIRIGGRSQATELESKNLRVVSKGIEKTRVESQTLGMSYGDLEDCMSNAGYAMKPLHRSRNGLSWDAMDNFLYRKWPTMHRQLVQPNPDGFTPVTEDKLLNWLGVKSMNPKEDENDGEIDDVRLDGLIRAAREDIHSLSLPDRKILAKSWFKEWQETGTASLFEALDRAADIRKDINAVHNEINRRALIQADVVGITTTSLARNIDTLRCLETKVVICEEAAEVMEAHVASALMPGVEHFIQIGDHRQLRPQVNNHALSLESSTGKLWQLDRSQFERRAVGEPGLNPAPVAQLDVQRRMRPEISQLIRSVYPKLEDHESVKSLPNVVGMRNNLFWLDHRCDEDSADDGSRVKSHSNEWEVDMATALVRHLVRQGEYKPTDIALLTPYTGQLRKLRTSLSNDFEICLSERDLQTLAADGFEKIEDDSPKENTPKAIEKKALLQTLRLATVDNFQGEEAKVIIVSLVRSNKKRKVGFLRTENRINVLLSRAQHGMYLIGNAETYLNVPMWADVHSQLTRANAVGTELALCCPRHPDTSIICSEPHDFERKSPEGGCSLPCTRRLEPCGHQCQAKCHSVVMHDGFACGKPCPRIRSTCAHECPKLCGDDCGPCMIKINDVELPCGHIRNESVDGMVGLNEVYTRDKDGKFDGLQDFSSSLASTTPSCPDCKVPIRQFVTRRYNRVINRAVMDETWKRFLTKGRTELQGLETRLNEIAENLTSTKVKTGQKSLTERWKACLALGKEASALMKTMDAENQPIKRLRDAITIYKKSPSDEIASLSARTEAMKITKRGSNNQISLGARLIYHRAEELMWSDFVEVMESRSDFAASSTPTGEKLLKRLSRMLCDFRDLISQANKGSLSRIAITATISFAKIVQLVAWYHRIHPGVTKDKADLQDKLTGLETLEERTEATRQLLSDALELCQKLGNCPELQDKVQEMARLFEGPRYETVTLEELQSIKTAMVSGRGGIATHSRHWYNCANGHPFAIGECGMPMEQARCPECGAPIGGSSHRAVEGVSRALQME